MPDPQVSFAIVARDAAGQVLADVQLDLEQVADRARRAGSGVSAFGAAAGGAEPGVRKMENAIQNLAGRAAGIDGPMGKLLEGALSFGVGGTAVAGFAAGFFAMSQVMQFFGRDAAEAEERLLSLRQEKEKLDRTPVMDASQRKVSAQTQLNDAAKTLERLQSGDFTTGEKLRFNDLFLHGGQTGQDVLNAEMQRLRGVMDESAAEVASFNADVKKQTAAAEKELAALGDQTMKDLDEFFGWTTKAKELAAHIAAQLKFAAQGAGVDGSLMMGTPSGRQMSPSEIAERAKRGMAFLFDPRADVGSSAVARLRAEANKGGQSPAEKEASQAALHAAIVTRTANQLQVLSGGISLLGSVAGFGSTQLGTFAQGIGGILSGLKGINPLVGAGLGIGGSIINVLFGHHRSDPLPVHVASFAPQAVDDLSRRIVPPQPINLFRGDRANADIALARARDADARDRGSRVARSR